MKKIVLMLALFGLVFQTTSCKSKKTQDDTEIVENADVEKIEAEDSDLMNAENSDTNVGPVDESLQAALGETSEVPTDTSITEPAVTETPAEVVAAPTLDEQNLGTPPADTSSSLAATEQNSEPTLDQTGESTSGRHTI